LDVPAGLAFDASGNLWVANSTGQTIVEFVASQIVASGSPTPNAVIGSVNTPSGLAFSPHATALPLR
jgi:DNA-binding beta-propeller fold protein YncE